MKTLKESVDKVISKLESEGISLPSETVSHIVDLYKDSLIETMIENGHTYVNDDIKLEIVSIQPRRYVLRGIEYSSTRTYKVKANIGEPVYKKISEFYDSVLGG